MNAAIAPFLKRALVVDTRSGKTYLIRSGLVVLTLLLLLMAHSTARLVGAPGLQFFSSIMGTNAFLICLAGPGLFASVIAGEKESLRLGLLKMTGLRPLWIILGSTSGPIIGAVLLLAVQLPFVALAVTLGGVLPGQVWAATLALGAHLVFIAGLAVFCSTICKRSSSAGRLCFALLAMYYIGTPLAQMILGRLMQMGRTGWLAVAADGVLGFLHDSSVFTRLSEVMGVGFSGSAVGLQVWADMAMGLLFMVLAWWAFERFTRSQVATGPGRVMLRGRWRLTGAFRPGRAWSNALAWKAFHFASGGRVGVVVKTLLAPVLVGVIVLISSGSRPSRMIDLEEVGGLLVGISIGVFCVDAVITSSRLFGNESKWRTLPTLAILPHSTVGMMLRMAFGAALGLVPYVVGFVMGLAMAPDLLVDVVSESLFTGVFFWLVGNFLLLLVMAAYFSLLLRRGGVLLAFVVWYFGMHVVTGVIGMLSFTSGFGMDSVFPVMGVASIMLSLVLFVMLVRRVETLAAR